VARPRWRAMVNVMRHEIAGSVILNLPGILISGLGAKVFTVRKGLI